MRVRRGADITLRRNGILEKIQGKPPKRSEKDYALNDRS
jgi:hypothetical protein